jgi:hypothetical protein
MHQNGLRGGGWGLFLREISLHQNGQHRLLRRVRSGYIFRFGHRPMLAEDSLLVPRG